MSKKNFDDFINKQLDTKNNIEKTINWDSKREEWLKYLAEFYETIKTFLNEYATAGKLSYQYSKKDIFEEYIGSYPVDVLDIKLGEQKVRLEPIGTNLIGAKGRVDLIGANGKIKFVLVNKNASSSQIKVNVWIDGEDFPKEEKEPQEIVEWCWKIATPPPRIQYINLEQDTFLEALIEVVGG